MVEKPCFGNRLGPQILVVFAKQPLAGKVKTRLTPPLTPAQAAELYAVSLQESVVRLQHPEWRQVICYAGERDYFVRRFPGVPLLPQAAGDLGMRLQAAAADLQATGGTRVILIGSDSPDLPVATVQKGFAALASADLTLAPAVDGGYVLIGTRCYLPELFRDIPWSTGKVLRRTLERAAALGLAVSELPGWEDLDDVASLQRLLQRSPESATAGYARALGIAPDASSSLAGCRSCSRE